MKPSLHTFPIEHVAWQVQDPVSVAAWYGEHLGLTVARKIDKPPHTHFLADAAGRTVIEWLDGAEVAHVFPDEWPAHFDFTKTGEAESLFLPASVGFDLFSLKTYSRSLAEQGWEKFRGDLWYRQTFPEIQVPAGKKLYVLFAGVDRFLKAWINGKEIGEGNGERAFNPVLLEVPEFQNQKENVLTVRVNNEAPTELGVGGLIRPVALIVK